MKKRNEMLLILTAFIWGVAFVAQSEGGDAVGSYTFNCIRNGIGAMVLIPVMMLLDRMQLTRIPKTREQKRTLLKGGIACGVVLCVASNLQQLGINGGTEAGKAGFLTACYILMVPIFGLFLGKKCSWRIWLGVVITVIGLYMLCMGGSAGQGFRFSDILILLCAVVFAGHILVIDHFSPLVDGVRMSCIQFATVCVLSSVPMVLVDICGFMGGNAAVTEALQGMAANQLAANQATLGLAERFSIGMGSWLPALGTLGAWVAILYAGCLSSGVAYTLQIIGQQGVNPTVASMLMSLESVFAVLAGWVLLKQHMSFRELFGCLLIFCAIVLAQLPEKEEQNQSERKR